jgi:DNA-binding response OmpR family regulator
MKRRVLIIDDDAAVREALGRVLTEAGYEVSAAADGEEGARLFGPEEVDLVLLDLNLPGQGGWEVFERLTARYPFVPIIIITGMTDQYRTALAAGVGALMEKPLEPAALLQTMAELLAQPKEAPLRRMCGYEDNLKYVNWKVR